MLPRVDTSTGEVATLRGPGGEWLEIDHDGSAIAIDARGRLLVANREGLHLVTTTGLAPGYFPQWTNLVWRPTRAAFRTLHPAAQAATRTVLLVAARAAVAEAAARRCQRGSLPTLPIELWHLILGLIEPHALGGGAGR